MSRDESWKNAPVTCPQRHLMLVAVDPSENSRRAVSYAARWASCSAESQVMLVHVVKEPSEDIKPDQEERDRELEEGLAASKKLLSKARQSLESAGVAPARVSTKTLLCTPPDTIAATLLEEKERGDYDTLVLGRRGVSKREEYIFGSVTTSLIRGAADICVWVVA